MNESMIASLLGSTREHFGMQMAWVALRKSQRSVLVEHVHGVLPAEAVTVGTELPYQATICAHVIGDGEAAFVADLAADPRTRDLEVCAALGIKSYIGAPIRRADGSIYGTICCFSTHTKPELTAAAARLLAFVATVIADTLNETPSETQSTKHARARIRTLLDNGGPDIVLQAVFDLPEMSVRGWEALARFPHGHGTPQTWFADAAQVGLGVELEMAAVVNGIAQLQYLPPRSRIGVNISPETLTDPRLHTFLRTCDPSSILLEITEHNPIEDYSTLTPSLTHIRDLGIPIAADDAGSGYAGLRHLVELRPTGIKLDRTIVANIDLDPARRAMAAAMAAFSAEMNIILLAEGVETLDELNTIYDLGITVAQGYLLHRPEPAYHGIETQLPNHHPWAAAEPDPTKLHA